MSASASEREDAEQAAAPAGAAAASGAAPQLHAKSFKLRFATQHELGRSNVSAVKPLGLPSVVRGAWGARDAQRADTAREASALRRVQAMFGAGPRDKHRQPLTSAHEVGWWWDRAARADPRLQHHIRDSAWLKERLRTLPADNGLKRR